MKPAAQMSFGEKMLPRAIAKLRPLYSGILYDLVQRDAIEALEALPDASVDLVFADPPYRLSDGGSTCRAGERVPVAKGQWDESAGRAADHAFNLRWLAEVRRVLKPDGTLWVSGTQHIIFSVGFALQELGFNLLNTVTWFKPNASPNLSCRMLTHSTELLIWAAPAEYSPLAHTFNYQQARADAGGVQMRDMWEFPAPNTSEKMHGAHPTQKPLALLDRIICVCTNVGDVVLDIFNGSGTTGVAAVSRRRRYIGVDLERKYLELTARRLFHPHAPKAAKER